MFKVSRVTTDENGRLDLVISLSDEELQALETVSGYKGDTTDNLVKGALDSLISLGRIAKVLEKEEVCKPLKH